MLTFLAGLLLGAAGAIAWKERAYRDVRDRLARLTDRDEKGRFTRRAD